MDNPLYNGSGKGSNPRNCHTPKFRKNYDGINWGKKKTPYRLDFVLTAREEDRDWTKEANRWIKKKKKK